MPAAARNGSTELTDKHGQPWKPGAGMQHRRFGRTQLNVPVFSCGGMRFMYGVDLLSHKFGGRRLCSGYTTVGLLLCGAPAAVGLGVLAQWLTVGGGARDIGGTVLPWWAVASAVGVLYYAALVKTYLGGNQANLQACLEASFEHGITHIETAKVSKLGPTHVAF